MLLAFHRRACAVIARRLAGAGVALAAALLLAACGGGGDSAPPRPATAFTCGTQTATAAFHGWSATASLAPACNAPPTSCHASPATATCSQAGGSWTLASGVAATYAITWDYAGGTDVAAGTADGGTVDVRSTVANQVPLVVDAGPDEFPSINYNRLFVDVTVCLPGSATQCATIDHVVVDTGSIGLRLFDSAAIDALGLPTAAVGGADVWSCQQFAATESWGSLKLADIRLGGEVAPSMSLQLMNDPAMPVPAACSGIGLLNTAQNYKAKGILGLKNSGIGIQQGGLTWSLCSGSGCRAASAAEVAAIPNITNPVASFGADANGMAIQLPLVPANGATSIAGTMTFGIGTQADNALGSATVLRTDGYTVRTLWQGTSYTSVLDSGTALNSLPAAPMLFCAGAITYCPTSTQAFSAVLVGVDGSRSAVTFDVANYNELFAQATEPRALDDVAMQMDFPDAPVIWGLPFFFGRTVYIAYSGAPTPVGPGPFVAF